ncbi:MAG: DUF2147 domain-containing protein [Betaproteobacteria bacterium]|nr:DUF2147 domain-containing protein [Betaproteobacteria bacterium]MDE2056864.1 DUF2147 domain-containing protein [Betaproteobacteria bacterium]
MLRKLSLIVLISVVNLAYASSNLTGVWQTFNEQHQPNSLVEITEQQGQLVGKVILIYPEQEHDSNPVCDKCKGVNHNRPVLGMTILWGFSLHNGQEGYILDPETGNVYHATLTLQHNQLLVRGYIGIPLFGRSVIWSRIR